MLAVAAPVAIPYTEFFDPGPGNFSSAPTPGPSWAAAAGTVQASVTGSGAAAAATAGLDPSEPGALPYEHAIPLAGPVTTVKARALNPSTGEWSALAKALFSLPPAPAAPGNSQSPKSTITPRTEATPSTSSSLPTSAEISSIQQEFVSPLESPL